MTALSDKVAAKVAGGFVRLGQAGSIVTGYGTASPTTTAVTLVGPVNDIERYTATGADTKATATFYVQASDLAAAPRNGDQITSGGKVYGVTEVSSDGVHGTDIVYTLDAEEIGT